MDDKTRRELTMSESPDRMSGLVKYMLQHGKKITSERVERRDLLRKQPEMATWCMPGDILGVLLREVRWTEHHLGDLAIGIDYMRKEFLEAACDHDIEKPSGFRLFGFRRDGVDGTGFTESRFDEWYCSNNYGAMAEYYRRIILVEWHTLEDQEYDFHNGDIQVTAYDVTHDHPYQTPFSYAEAEKILAAMEEAGT